MHHKVQIDIPSRFLFEPVSPLNAPMIIRKIKEAAEIFNPLMRHLKNADTIVLLDYNDSTSLELWDKKKDESVLQMKIATTHKDSMDFKIIPINPVSLLREIIQSRQAPYIFVKKSLPKPRDVREQRARETLLSIIGKDRYRDFLKKGFVCVQNTSSKRVYQIYTGHDLVNVYEDGKKIERLCTHLPFEFPPTDSLIVRYLLAINDEEKLWSLSNKHGLDKKKEVKIDRRPLPEIFRALKQEHLALAS